MRRLDGRLFLGRSRLEVAKWESPIENRLEIWVKLTSVAGDRRASNEIEGHINMAYRRKMINCNKAATLVNETYNRRRLTIDD